jgi:hypothetical protein
MFFLLSKNPNFLDVLIKELLLQNNTAKDVMNLKDDLNRLQGQSLVRNNLQEVSRLISFYLETIVNE